MHHRPKKPIRDGDMHQGQVGIHVGWFISPSFSFSDHFAYNWHNRLSVSLHTLACCLDVKQPSNNNSLSLSQHILACCWHVKQPTNNSLSLSLSKHCFFPRNSYNLWDHQHGGQVRSPSKVHPPNTAVLKWKTRNTEHHGSTPMHEP